MSVCGGICCLQGAYFAAHKRTGEDSMGLLHRLAGVTFAAGLIAAAQIFSGHAARADAVQDLAAAAAKKGPVIWYESSPPEQILKIAAAFNKRYPDIKIQF